MTIVSFMIAVIHAQIHNRTIIPYCSTCTSRDKTILLHYEIFQVHTTTIHVFTLATSVLSGILFAGNGFGIYNWTRLFYFLEYVMDRAKKGSRAT